VAAGPPHAVRCLKSHGGHSVWLVHRPGFAPRIRKVWPITPWTLIKYCFGIAQPQRQVRGANRLHKAGLATPAVVQPLTIEFTHGRLILELAYAEGESALDMLRADSINGTRMMECAAAIGSLVPQIADARLFNRDLKLSNLIVQDVDGQWIIWLIDPVGVRLGRNRIEELTRMLHRLASEPVVMGIAIPRAAAAVVLLSALRQVAPAERREVLRRLRQRRPH
jgi:tRNA A-37 threonylcarbamoyl transferase component Bud32